MLPSDITKHILAKFHPSRQVAIQLDLVDGRPGFWNWDKSHFIPCGDSIAAMRREIANPSPHYPEDTLGLGLLN